MTDADELRLRREALEALSKISPTAEGIWNDDRSDPDRLLRIQVAEELMDEGLMKGGIGADGVIHGRLTPRGRRRVADGEFGVAGAAAAQPSRPTAEELDRTFMKLAIEEARKSKAEDDRVHPMVGAVVVRGGQVIGKAHRGELGPGDHGEFTLLEKKLADATLAGSTVYVTLEPCTTRNHPKLCCARRLLERRVARVVIGMVDPDSRISGRGITMLRQGAVEIGHFYGDLAAEVEELNRHFIRSVAEREKEAASNAPASGSSVEIAIHNSTVGGDVVGGDKKS